jgi:hypothetical protein
MQAARIGLLIAIAGAGLAAPAAAPDCESCVVISQVYGGGGNNGAAWTNDFIELFNRGDRAVDLTGWSVQYASAAGVTWSRTLLSGTIEPGGYYLVQEGRGAGGGSPLPAPDAAGSIALSSTAGKVALVAGVHALRGSDPGADQGVVDLVGFGGAHAFKGSAPAPSPSNTSAIVRGGFGCFHTADNGADFVVTPSVAPRGSAVSPHPCPGVLVIRTQPELPAARQRADYMAALAAAGGSGEGYRYTLVNGSLPPGIALAGEALRGVPATAAGSPYSFTLRVTDSQGNSGVKNFYLPVLPDRNATITAALR